eukprot:384037_1
MCDCVTCCPSSTQFNDVRVTLDFIDHDGAAQIYAQYNGNILILGTDSVGKATISKCIIASNLNTKDFDCKTFSNECIKTAINDSIYSLRILLTMYKEIEDEDNQVIMNKYKRFIEIIDEYSTKNNDININYKELGNAIDIIWNLNSIQKIYQLRLKNKYYIADNIDYCLNKINYFINTKWINIDDYLNITIKEDENEKQKDKIETYSACPPYYNISLMTCTNKGNNWYKCMKSNQSHNSVTCLLYVCALNQYCLSNENLVCGLHENISFFKNCIEKLKSE